MKIKIFDRILASILALVVIAAVALFAAVALDIITLNEVINYATSFLPNVLTAKLFYSAAALLALIIAVRVMVGMAGTKEKVSAPTSIHLSNSEHGSTFVSLAALDAMTQRHCRAVPKVKDCYTNIVPDEKGIRIAVKLVLSNEANIPELTKALQKSLKEYIEGLSGVAVADVSILVISAPIAQKAQS